MTAAAESLQPGGATAPAEASVPWARMGVALLALVGTLISGYLTLHRLGLIGRLYCGAGGSCETVQSSKYAVILGVPVAYIGLVGYIALLAVALAGLQPTRAGDRRVSLALLALCVPAVAFTIYLNLLEAYVIHAWCRWCIVSATVIGLILILALADLVVQRRQAVEPAAEDT